MITLKRRQLELAMIGLIAYQGNFETTQAFISECIEESPDNAPALPTYEEVIELGNIFVKLLDGGKNNV